MENSFQTSFIPKKPIIANGSSSKSSDTTTSISMVVSVFILVVMLLAGGGLYAYKEFVLVKEKQALSENLKKIKESFNKDTITELEMYDKRTTVVREVLNNHIVLSPLFEKINELTLSSIQYNKFEHKTTNNVFSVRMSGIASDYKSIALQADVFNTEKGVVFKDVIFSNLTKDKNNFVTFELEFNVDPSLLSYSNRITNIESPSTDLQAGEAQTEESLQVTNNTP
ncbi:MAG: hypothetical protein WCW65_01650 [Candidatus Paceibacterota bacterium]